MNTNLSFAVFTLDIEQILYVAKQASAVWEKHSHVDGYLSFSRLQ